MAYRIVPMGPEHAWAVLRLWREALYDPRIAAVADDRYAWFYDENPAGRPATWLGLVEGTGEIVGCVSAYRRTTWVGRRAMRTGVVGDFAVDKAHRSAGCAVSLQRAIAGHGGEEGFDFLYGYPNKGSLPVVKRVGYEVLGEAVPYAKPLRTAGVLRDRIRRGALPGRAGRLVRIPLVRRAIERAHAAEAAGLLVDLGLAALDLYALGRRLASHRVEDTARADARFDALWSRRDDTRTMGEKTAAYLNWRYASHKTASFRFFCLAPRNQRDLAGYLVYLVEGDKAFVVDLFTPRCDETVDHLLLHFAVRMRRRGLSLVYLAYFGDPAFGERIERLRFFKRPADRQVVFHPGDRLPAETLALLRDRSRWFMLDGELDI